MKRSEEEERLINELYRPPPDELIYPSLIDSFVGKYEGKRDENNHFTGYGFLEIPNHFRYRGNFLNGYLNGKGSIIFEDQTRYEGDFENNRLMSGPEKGHFIYPDSGEYFGEVANGYRHGKGKYILGDKTYEGSWRCDQRDGFGKMIFSSQGNSYYEGEFKENRRCGEGKMVYEGGDLYEGRWKNNLKNGKGKMSWKDLGESYEGNWKNGFPDGMGCYSYMNFGEQVMNYFVGHFRKGKREGFGTFYYSDGSKYSGYFRSDKKHGDGVFEHVNGICEELSFDQDTLIRDGKKSLFTVGRLKSLPIFINDLLFKLRGNMKRNEIFDIQRVVSRNIPKLHILYRRYCLYLVEQEEFFDKLIRCSKKNEMSKLQLYKFLLTCGLVNSSPQGSDGIEEIEEEEEDDDDDQEDNFQTFNHETISLSEVNRIIIRTLEQQKIIIKKKKKRRRRRKKKREEEEQQQKQKQQEKEAEEEEEEQKKKEQEEEQEGEGEEKKIVVVSDISKIRQNVFAKDYEVKIPDMNLEYKDDIHNLDLHPIQFRSFVEVLVRVAIEIFMEPPCLSKKLKSLNNEEGKVYVALRKCFEGIIIPNIDEKFEDDEEEMERTYFIHQDPKHKEIFNNNSEFLKKLFHYFCAWRDFHRDSNRFRINDCVMTYRQFFKMFQKIEGKEFVEIVKSYLFNKEYLSEEDIKEKLNREIIFDEFVAMLFRLYQYKNCSIVESLELLKEKCFDMLPH